MFSCNNFRIRSALRAPCLRAWWLMQCASPRDRISATLWILEKQYPRAILRRRFGNTTPGERRFVVLSGDGWLNRRRKKSRDMVFEEHRVSSPSRPSLSFVVTFRYPDVGGEIAGQRGSTLLFSASASRESENCAVRNSMAARWEEKIGERTTAFLFSIAPSGDESFRVTRECVHQPSPKSPFCTAHIHPMHIGIDWKYTSIFIDLFLYFQKCIFGVETFIGTSNGVKSTYFYFSFSCYYI